MKQYLCILLCACLMGAVGCSRREDVSAKPVIYLYPEEETQVSVTLDFAGELTTTYPTYGEGWQVTAKPDGTLIDAVDGKEYSYLFWEGTSQADYDLSEGFVVAGDKTKDFLQETLAKLGLTPKEYNEFIVYWLPRMEQNAYNLITFQGEAYNAQAKLTVSPEPDSVLRVFMVFQPLDAPIEIPEPELPAFERSGFTLVEWGGLELQP